MGLEFTISASKVDIKKKKKKKRDLALKQRFAKEDVFCYNQFRLTSQARTKIKYTKYTVINFLKQQQFNFDCVSEISNKCTIISYYNFKDKQ